jgi:5-methylcytosine-specific restriction enzyme A
MPTRPPLFRPAWYKPAPTRKSTRSLTGERLQRVRARVFAEQPLCVMCEAEGRIGPSEELDHIVPLSQGGTDERSNLQGLCVAHHAEKSAGERMRRKA